MERILMVLDGGVAAGATRRPRQAGERPRVLVVDDDRDFGALVVEHLGEAGFQARAAASAGEALRLAFDEFPPDALVVDLHLPGGLDGWQLAGLVRRACPEVVVVVATGAERGSLPDLPYRVFYKPLQPEALSAALARVLELRADDR